MLLVLLCVVTLFPDIYPLIQGEIHMSDDAIHDILEQTESDPAFHALFELFDYSNLLCFHFVCCAEHFLKIVFIKHYRKETFYNVYLQVKHDSLMANWGMEILAVVQKRDLYRQSDPFLVIIQVFLQCNSVVSSQQFFLNLTHNHYKKCHIPIEDKAALNTHMGTE